MQCKTWIVYPFSVIFNREDFFGDKQLHNLNVHYFKNLAIYLTSFFPIIYILFYVILILYFRSNKYFEDLNILNKWGPRLIFDHDGPDGTHGQFSYKGYKLIIELFPRFLGVPQTEKKHIIDQIALIGKCHVYLKNKIDRSIHLP